MPEETKPVQIEKGEVSPAQMKEIESGAFFTVKEVAEKLCYTQQWVREMLEAGRIKGIKPFGARWRIAQSEFHRILKEGTPPMPREKKQPPIKEIEVPEEVQKQVRDKTKEERESSGGLFPFNFGGD